MMPGGDSVGPVTKSKQLAYGLSVLSVLAFAVCAGTGGVAGGLLGALAALFCCVSVPLTMRAVFRRRQRSRGEGHPESEPLETAALWWLSLVWIASLGWVVVCLVILATFHLDRLF